MKIIYISSPYSMGDQAANVRRQILAAHVVMDLGHAPIAPLLTHFLHVHRPRPYEEWMAVDLKLVEKADVVWRLAGRATAPTERWPAPKPWASRL